MASFFHCLVLLGSVIGGYIFLIGLLFGKDLGNTVVALAFVIIPYCAARSIEYLSQPASRDEDLVATLNQINYLLSLAVKMGEVPAPPPPAPQPRRSPLTGR